MKKIFFLVYINILLVLFVSCSLNESQKLFDRINNEVLIYFNAFYDENDKYLIKTSDVFGLSSQGGQTEKYYKDNQLKRITMLLYGEMGKSESDFYIINKDLVYVVIKNYDYDKPFSENPDIIKKYIERYYIVNNKVMKYDLKNKDLVSNNNNNILYQFQTSLEVLD